ELRGGVEESAPSTVAAVFSSGFALSRSRFADRRRSPKGKGASPQPQEKTAATVPSIAIDRRLFAALNSDPLFPGLAQFNGSNSWVVGPKRSKSGQALLANDPHITF